MAPTWSRMIGLAKRLNPLCHIVTKTNLQLKFDHQVLITSKHAYLQRALPQCQHCTAKVLQGARPYRLGRSEKYFSSISISDTLFPLYFSILRQVCFLAFFDLRTPSFANFPVCVYIADLHGEVGQNILGG